MAEGSDKTQAEIAALQETIRRAQIWVKYIYKSPDNHSQTAGTKVAVLMLLDILGMERTENDLEAR